MMVLLLAILNVLNYALTLGILLWDRGRLTDKQRARAWKLPATWGCAVYCAPFSLWPWVWVTRQEWAVWRRRGLGHALVQSAWLLLTGAAAAAVLFIAIFVAIGSLLATALGIGVK